MALTESIEYDKIEVVGQYKKVQVRKATVIKKDGVELTRSFHRHVLNPDADISKEPEEVKAIPEQPDEQLQALIQQYS